jgi:DNA-binding CsgD family transcriptional regulator
VNLEEPHAGTPYHEEALAIVERLADAGGVAETVDLIAMSHHVAGAQAEAAQHYTRSLALFAERDDRRGLANALALLALCGPSYQSSSTTPVTSVAVEQELRELRSARLARDIGWRAGEAFVRFILADCLMWRGDYERAIGLVRESLGYAREIEHLEWTAGALRILGGISLDLLAPKLACEQLQASHDIARRLGSRVWYRWTAAPLAIALSEDGEIEAAFRMLESAERVSGRDGDESKGPESASLTLGERLLWLVRAELELVRHEPARALAIAESRIRSERAANPTNLLGVPRLTFVQAKALAALGRDEEADAAYDAAQAQASAQGALPMLWRIEAARGHRHRERKERLEARRAFTSARNLTNELATKVPDEELRNAFLIALQSLIPHETPPSPRRLAKEALGGLTKRERDVAELVAQGNANRVIARALGIGERTVEGYVASALAKLDFTSRTQLAAWAIDQGIGRAPAPRARR